MNFLALQIILILLVLILHVSLILAVKILLLHFILTLLLLFTKRHSIILGIQSIPRMLHICLEFLFVSTNPFTLLLHYT